MCSVECGVGCPVQCVCCGFVQILGLAQLRLGDSKDLYFDGSFFLQGSTFRPEWGATGQSHTLLAPFPVCRPQLLRGDGTVLRGQSDDSFRKHPLGGGPRGRKR